jgi:hypothetical protein
MREPTTVLPIGGCLLHGPLNPLARERERLAYPKYGPFPGVYTFGEIFQALDILLGKRDVPPEIRPLANIRPNFVARPAAAGFDEVDVTLVEPSLPIDLDYKGCKLNRTTLTQIVLNPIKVTSKEANKATNLWLRTGLIGLDENVRSSAAEELVKHIPADLADKKLITDVILETRSSRADVLEGFRRIHSIVQKPMGIVVYVFQYLPDGRALSWPEGFLEEIVAAAEELDIPVFQPADVVRSYGVKEALRDDLRHYKDEFMPVIAESLAEFADFIATRGREEIASVAAGTA